MTDFASGNPSGLQMLQEFLLSDILTERHIARAISLIEDSHLRAGDIKMLKSNHEIDDFVLIGVTGSPGVGKSTFLNSLLKKVNFPRKLAVLAVDPSSPLSGGAILGDRIRVESGSINESVFFRSLSSRGAYGGISHPVEAILEFLRLAGISLVLVETVGTGQNEIEIVKHVDLVVHIMDSQSGDEIQLSKAGIMEIGNLYFVNKSDLNSTSGFASKLASELDSVNPFNNRPRCVVSGSAKNGEGFREVLDFINKTMGLEL